MFKCNNMIGFEKVIELVINLLVIVIIIHHATYKGRTMIEHVAFNEVAIWRK